MLLKYAPQIIASIITLLSVSALRFAISRLTKKYVATHANSQIKATHTNRISAMFINTASIIILIVIWGVDTKNLFVALSSVFAVIGVALFAQWSVLSNITAGVIIFFTASFRIGNYIRILDKDMPIEAKVEDIFTFYTHLRSKDGVLHVFPNNMLLQKAVTIIREEE
jgi:small-conductance mechanosensitive channel